MNKHLLRIAIGFLLLMGIIVPIFSSNDPSHYFGLIPPVVALGIAILTGRVILGLTISIFSAGFLASIRDYLTVESKSSNTSIEIASEGLFDALTYLWTSINDPWNLQILMFVSLMMASIAVMVNGGGIRGVLEKLLVFANSRKSTLWITYVMGLVLFFDDYANTMIVGTTARPLTDSFKISRPKLAFIVDATAAPMAGLAFVSTWIGYEVGLFGEINQTLNLGTDGYSMFFDAIGFRYYCIFMLAFIFMNIWTNRDFGPMLNAEVDALKNGIPKTEMEPSDGEKGHFWVGIIPLATLLVSVLGGLWLDGSNNLPEGTAFSPLSLVYWKDLLSAAENSVTVFAVSGCIVLTVSIVSSILIGKISAKFLAKAIWEGLVTALTPTLILILAWSLKKGCEDLGTAKLIGELVTSSIPDYSFPVILFLVSAVVAFSTGTSWGTMSLLIPIAIPIAYQFDGNTYGLLTMICLGSVLDGAILGDHASPISDTTIMSSAGAKCPLMDHVRTQAPYSIVVGLAAILVGYIPATFGVSSIISIVLGMVICFGIFKVFGRSPEEISLVRD